MCVGAYGHMGETGIQGTKHARQLLSNPGSSNRIIATDLITNIRRSILAAVGERLEIKKKGLPTLYTHIECQDAASSPAASFPLWIYVSKR